MLEDELILLTSRDIIIAQYEYYCDNCIPQTITYSSKQDHRDKIASLDRAQTFSFSLNDLLTRSS